jgi:predicted permease
VRENPPLSTILLYITILTLRAGRYVAIFFGYLLAKRGLFPPAASRGASYVTMNLALPALIFANVVPAFTSSNVSALGPMFLLAYLYQGMGFIFGMVIREVLYVPRNFWQGIVIMTGMSNWGNLRTLNSVNIHHGVLIVFCSQRYHSERDRSSAFRPIHGHHTYAAKLIIASRVSLTHASTLLVGVSYVAIFIVSFHINFWIFGAASSLSWDYLPGVPQGVEAEKRLPWHEKPLGRLIHRHILRRDAPACDSTVRGIAVQDDTGSPDIEKGSNDTDQRIDVRAVLESSSNASSPRPSDGTIVEVSRVPSPTSLDSRRSLRTSSPSSSSEAVPNAPVIERKMHLVLFRRACAPVRALFQHPIPVTLLVALLIALVQDIKALFVHISGAAAPKWHGPDGRPPLAFIMDTGARSPPLYSQKTLTSHV